jgi:hypothetical protein
MHGDLISKSELLESLNDWIDENTDIKTILRWIEEFEIAYDVEKVVAELESFATLAEDRWVNGTSNFAYQEHKCWVKAIDIVHNGGKELI